MPDEPYFRNDPDVFWKKFQRGIAREDELAQALRRWVDFRDARVLVIGSYLGMEALAYALRGADVTGIDLDRGALDVSIELAHRHGLDVDFQYGDATRANFADASFDFISCAQVLEHLPPNAQVRLLEEMWRLCKPGGYLWIDTPNQHRWLDQHDTGLPFIHWLPRALKIPLARMLGRSVTIGEPGFGGQVVYLHYYLSYLKLIRILAGLGPYQAVSRYSGYADMDHYAAERKRQGRDRSPMFPMKVALLRQLLKVWDWNILASTRVMIRKLPQRGVRLK